MTPALEQQSELSREEVEAAVASLDQLEGGPRGESGFPKDPLYLVRRAVRPSVTA